MARPGAYKSAKRRKELMRQKKQEEKRKKRLLKKVTDHQDPFAVQGPEDGGIENYEETENPEENVNPEAHEERTETER